MACPSTDSIQYTKSSRVGLLAYLRNEEGVLSARWPASLNLLLIPPTLYPNRVLTIRIEDIRI